MTTRRMVKLLVLSTAVMCLAAGRIALHAQPPRTTAGRFEFQVIESFDSKYLGDTPGHVGRGSLAGTRPDVALGDPVYRDRTKIGTVTNVTWDRTRESLAVEFDPEPFESDASGRPVRPVRITVGQDVWIPLGGGPGAPTPKKVQ